MKKYLGRITAVFVGLIVVAFHSVVELDIDRHDLFIAAITTFITLWFGVQYDKSRLYLEELTKSRKKLVRDITERKIIEKTLMETEAKYRSLVEGAFVGIYIYQNGRIIYANPRFKEIIGYTNQELAQINILDLIIPEDKELLTKYAKMSQNVEHIHEHIRGIKKDGSIIYIELHASKTVYHDKNAFIGTIHDVTEQKKVEKKINQLAFYDALTGLSNRYLLNKYLQYFIKRSEQQKMITALMFIDLDRFKLVNDTLGHNVGDLLLQQAAERLKNCIRQNDLVSHYGGDKFVVLLENIGRNEVTKIAERMLNEFKSPFLLMGHVTFVTPSIGISIYPYDGEDIETLIRSADIAMYLAKEDGKNTYRFYTTELSDKYYRKLQLENALRKGL
ncbi:diguanylate cyclase [Tepidibacillus infernus]|uniref:diguanylate cyclase domain-containing protein n=1 Tax=Tepidibacillus infernus TaxID=1806172 RepID=UPI003B723DD5